MIKELNTFKNDLKAYRINGIFRIIWNLLTSSGLEAVLLYRIQNYFERTKKIPIAKLISRLNHKRNGIDFVVGSKIDSGLVIRHPSGVVIGNSVIAGKNLTILSSVVLGQKGINFSHYNDGNPTIGNNVTIGAHSIVLGAIKIADGVVVKANSLVLQDLY